MIAVAGAGAFGTALALVLAAREGVTLWGRDAGAMAAMAATRANPRLPGAVLPDAVLPTADAGALAGAEVVVLAVPAQALGGFLAAHSEALAGTSLVAVAKGIDLATLEGPSALVARHVPGAVPAVLTGPSFAADLARGLPTALTLACRDVGVAEGLQARLATPALRLYRTGDVAGAELGGALKNVVAIACGASDGAGLGESARAALLTRGFAEMRRLAVALGAEEATLMGLSGLGDLVLTATSPGSRNFRLGIRLGWGLGPEPGVTVEGAATAGAAVRLGIAHGVATPVAEAVAGLVAGTLDVGGALRHLLDRPLREE